ncbi:MAG TPA: uroporphyrinogen-III synthase [Anaerolineales bacterium]|nr:uroporphyrinogen-III synthase [Anaerolineales bacterium]
MKRILITRPRAQAEGFAQKLRAAGFEPVYFPVIKIQPIENNVALERALGKLDCYDWIVFTSVNAVEVVFDGHSPLILKVGSGVNFAAIGPKTAEALEAHGVHPDFVPKEYVAEAVLPGLGDLRGKWILLPRAEIARKALPEAICEAGGIAHEIAVYRTLPAEPDPDGLVALKAGVDVITLTSSSTVHNFMSLARAHGLDPLRLPGNPLFACIGPVTEQTAREEGLVNLMTAREFTTEGLVEAINNVEVS